MFVRIVKMTFRADKVDDFLIHFDQHKNSIRNFEGCKFLELYRDKTDKNIFFTYSFWEDDCFLEQYRTSDLFKAVWETTKLWFAAKPEAWSLNKVDSLGLTMN